MKSPAPCASWKREGTKTDPRILPVRPPPSEFGLRNGAKRVGWRQSAFGERSDDSLPWTVKIKRQQSSIASVRRKWHRHHHDHADYTSRNCFWIGRLSNLQLLACLSAALPIGPKARHAARPVKHCAYRQDGCAEATTYRGSGKAVTGVSGHTYKGRERRESRRHEQCDCPLLSAGCHIQAI